MLVQCQGGNSSRRPIFQEVREPDRIVGLAFVPTAAAGPPGILPRGQRCPIRGMRVWSAVDDCMGLKIGARDRAARWPALCCDTELTANRAKKGVIDFSVAFTINHRSLRALPRTERSTSRLGSSPLQSGQAQPVSCDEAPRRESSWTPASRRREPRPETSAGRRNRSGAEQDICRR
jgi:hypothetical protein